MKKLITLAVIAASFVSAAVQAESYNMHCQGRNVVYSINEMSHVSITVDGSSYPVGQETLRQPDPQGNGMITMQSAANMKGELAAIFVTDVSLAQRKAWLMLQSGDPIECVILN